VALEEVFESLNQFFRETLDLSLIHIVFESLEELVGKTEGMNA
jgi:hypothetical protein